MKTILVDAWNTLITKDGVDPALKKMLDDFPNPKIIVTNANTQEQQTYGMVDLPYPLFTMAHKPNKTDPEYFRALFKKFVLSAERVVYFEHHPEAIIAAHSLGITACLFDYQKRDIESLKAILAEAL